MSDSEELGEWSFLIGSLQRAIAYERNFQEELKIAAAAAKLDLEREIEQLKHLHQNQREVNAGLQQIYYQGGFDASETIKNHSELSERLAAYQAILSQSRQDLVQKQRQQSLLESQLAKSARDYQNALQQEGQIRRAVSNIQAENKRLSEQTEESQIQKDKMVKQLEDIYLQKKRLNNQLQELKGNIRVYCRIRPSDPNQTEVEHPVEVTSDSTLRLRVSRETYRSQMQQTDHNFMFQQIFDQKSDQEAVFNELSQLVQSAVDGKNVCIFAYGQTGSGKTFTMQGDQNYNNRGIIPRSVELIFSQIQKAKDFRWYYRVVVSIQEIYLENVRDLLNIGSESQICTETEVNNTEDVYFLLNKATQNRKVASTHCNQRSSRSHLVFSLKMTAENEEKDKRRFGSLNMIDLAGSERVSVSKVEGDRLRETQFINKSLTQLGVVIVSMKKKDAHIPFRSSKLTFLLQRYLEGDSKTLMFVNISPNLKDINQTLNSLRFAETVRQCKLKK